MPYRATVRFDFRWKTVNTHRYQELVSGLINSGWKYVETSALFLETEDSWKILLGVELITRQIPVTGRLSALLIDVQFSNNFEDGVRYTAVKNNRNAIRNILRRPVPSEDHPGGKMT